MDFEKYEKFGFISASQEDHLARIHTDGFYFGSPPVVRIMPGGEKKEPYLVFFLDPFSPFGEMMSNIVIPFNPPKGFHFDQASFWVYRVNEEEACLEIRWPKKAYFDNEKREFEEVHGIRFKLAEFSCHELRFIEK